MRERIIADAAPRRRRERRRGGRAGWRCAIASATSPSAPSTRSATRCCASSRSRPASLPASRVADETESARLAEDAIDRALARCRAIAALGSGGGAGAHADHAAAAARGAGAPGRSPPRRAVGPAPLHRPRGRASTPEALTARAVARFRDALQALPGGLPAFLADGPDRASALRPHRRRSPRHRARATSTIRRRSRPSVETLRFYFTDQDRHAAPAAAATAARRSTPSSEAGWKRHAQAIEARRAGGVRGAPGLRPRPQRAARARHRAGASR